MPKGTQNYAWTVFRPDAAALQELRQSVEQQREGLSIGLRMPLAGAGQAFDHVRSQRRGRALIVPE